MRFLAFAALSLACSVSSHRHFSIVNVDISLVNGRDPMNLTFDLGPRPPSTSRVFVLFRAMEGGVNSTVVSFVRPAAISTTLLGSRLKATTPTGVFGPVSCCILNDSAQTCCSNIFNLYFYDWRAAVPISSLPAIRSSGGSLVCLSLGDAFRGALAAFQNSEAVFSTTPTLNALPGLRSVVRVDTDLLRVCMSSPPLDFPAAEAATSLHLFLSPNGRTYHNTGVLLSVQDTLPLRVGFGFIGRVDDEGWTSAHDVGRLALAAHFGRAVETVYEENMPFGQEQPIRDFLQREGVQMFIMCSSGYYTAVRQVATEFPAVQFAVVTDAAEFMGVTGSPRPTLGPNLNAFFASLTQPRYLSGIVAGAMARDTGAPSVGYICAFGDNTQVVEGLNAFARGVQRVAPGVRVVTYSIGTWADPFTERQAAEQMVADGVTILGHHSDSKDVMEVIVAAGGYGIGSNSDTRAALGERVLTAPMFVWSRLMIPLVQRALDGTLGRGGGVYEYGTLSDHSVLLSPLSSRVPHSARSLVRAEAARLRALPGAYGMFCGPLRDNTGALRAAAGVCLGEAELPGNMTWRVEGVGPMRPFVPILPTIAHPQALGGIATAGNAVSATLLLGLAAVSAALFQRRQQPSVRHASHRFCQLIVLGCAGMQSSVFLLGMDEGSEEELSAVCQALPWLLGMSIVATFAALFSKVWRVMRLFRNRTIRRRAPITDAMLGLIMLAVLLPEFLILATWSAAAPLQWREEVTQRDRFGHPTAVVGRCSSTASLPFLAALCAYKMLCLLVGNYLCYVTRSVPTSFNESKWVSLTMFNLFEVLLVLIPLHFVTDLPSVAYFVRAGAVTTSTLSVTAFVLLTKLRPSPGAYTAGVMPQPPPSPPEQQQQQQPPRQQPQQQPRLLRPARSGEGDTVAATIVLSAPAPGGSSLNSGGGASNVVIGLAASAAASAAAAESAAAAASAAASYHGNSGQYVLASCPQPQQQQQPQPQQQQPLQQPQQLQPLQQPQQLQPLQQPQPQRPQRSPPLLQPLSVAYPNRDPQPPQQDKQGQQQQPPSQPPQ